MKEKDITIYDIAEFLKNINCNCKQGIKRSSGNKSENEKTHS